MDNHLYLLAITVSVAGVLVFSLQTVSKQPSSHNRSIEEKSLETGQALTELLTSHNSIQTDVSVKKINTQALATTQAEKYEKFAESDKYFGERAYVAYANDFRASQAEAITVQTGRGITKCNSHHN